MSALYTSLADIGAEAMSHRAEVNEVKSHFEIQHGFLDAWIYGFLENKKFNIEETVAKLHRRYEMEVNELATYEFTDHMRDTLRKGIIQEIGEDKLGRLVFLLTSKREAESEEFREEQRQIFDMSICLGTRLRKDNKRCQMVMLINQEGASLLKGDLSTLANRVAKYYPGGVDKMFICKMGRMAAAMAKPFLKRMPAIVSERLVIVDDSDIKKGFLRDIFPDEVLPVEFGGSNRCDDAEHWNAYGEKVEAYYRELKDAVLNRQMTVKDWEMEKYGIIEKKIPSAPITKRHSSASPTPRASTANHQGGVTPELTDLEETLRQASIVVSPFEALKTCLSEELGGENYASTPHYPYGGGDGSGEGSMTWLEIMSHLPRPLGLFFLDELLKWRIEIEEQEDAQRYKLLEDHGKFLYDLRLKNTEYIFDIEDKKWYYGIPLPLRTLQRLILSFVTLMNAVYFIGALVFIACFCACVIVTLFFGTIVEYNYFFPLLCVLIMAMIQSACLCTRAFETASATCSGKIIPFLLIFGSMAKIVQIVLFSVLLAIQFIIFCIYASKRDPLRGLEVSFATGWFSATFIVGVTHLLYFTGFFASRKQSDNRLFALPLFVALGLRKSDEKSSKTKLNIRTSSIIICAIPTCISLLLGIAYLISRIIALYICTLVAGLMSAFVVSYYSKGAGNNLNGGLLRITLWIGTITWLFATFTFGLRNYSASWGIVVILSMIIAGLLITSSICTLNRRSSSLVFRILSSLTVIYLLGCWICCFPIIGYRMALFCLALMVHNFIGLVFSPKAMTSIYGVFFATTATLLLMIACILLGWYGTTVQYTSPQSLPSVDPYPATPFTPLQLYHRLPICSLTVGTTDSLTILDVELFTELVKAANSTLFSTDFDNWFGGAGVTYDGIVDFLSSDVVSWEMHRFIADGTTILVVNNRHATSSILGITAWVDSIALGPLSIFLPWDWISTVVYVMSFTTKLIAFKWFDLLDSLTLSLTKAVEESGGNLIVTGSGLAGGLVSISATRAKAQSIVFSSPGLLHLLRKMGITAEDYHSYALTVGAYSGILDVIGGRDQTVAQKLVCPRGDAQYCMSHMFLSNSLMEACGDSKGRKHVSKS